MKLLHASLLLFFCLPAMADDVKMLGNIELDINVPPSQGQLFSVNSAPLRRLSFLHLELSDKAKESIAARTQASAYPRFSDQQALSELPKKVQLGMASVPVLDQGRFGACVTFANTAAIDAVLNQGDYISQLCQLQLGRFLEKNAYTPSGWDGSFGGVVLNQMSVYGFVSKEKQRAQGCGGLTQYPSGEGEAVLGELMTPEAYHSLSEPMNMDTLAWSYITDIFQLVFDKASPDMIIQQVKEALNAGDRASFGVLLPAVNLGVAGAVGKYHASNDTWILTPEVLHDLEAKTDFPGHEMVITGYDDDAVVTDKQGQQHQGLLTLRNSWGDRMGDQGNFYMSYDYFKVLVLEVIRIRHMTK